MKGILDFFKNLFSSLFGGKKKTAQSKASTTIPKPPSEIILPEVDEKEPQDGSEITEETPVIVVNEKEPVIEGDDPFGIDPDDSTVNPEIALPDLPTLEDDPVMDVPVVVEKEPEVMIPTMETPVVIERPADEPKTHNPRYLWCLDNGHGSQTAGKRSPKRSDGTQLLEYRFNRDIVKRISRTLKSIGVKHFIVVPENDTDNFLEGRVTRANQKSSEIPKLFVSVHANAAPAPPGRWCSPSISGAETWYYHNSRRGKKLAAVFQKHIVAKTGFKNRHIKSRPTSQFYVLRNTGMTAILTENGFYNNQAECDKLMTNEVRQRIADAHVLAILEIEKSGV